MLLKFPLPSLWPGRQIVLCEQSWSDVGAGNAHQWFFRSNTLQTGRKMTILGGICKYLLYPTLHQWEYLWTSSNKKQKSISIPSDFMLETKSFDSNINTATQRSQPQLPSLNPTLSHYAWLVHWELTERSAWLILCSTLHGSVYGGITGDGNETQSNRGVSFLSLCTRLIVRLAGGMFNYIRLNSNNLLHILEVFLTAFGVMPLHVLIWLEQDNVGFPGATTISRYSQKEALQCMTTH